MKSLNQLLITILMLQIASCDQVIIADYSLKIHVVDQSDKVLSDANIYTSHVELTSPLPSGENKMNPVVKTDKNGTALIKYKSVHHQSGGPYPGAAVEKEGWYPTSVAAENWTSTTIGNNSSYHAELKALLRPIRNPIPMYAKSNMGEMSGYVRIPEMNKDYGYDLMLGQALPPVGKGKVADFYFRVDGSYTDRKSNDLKLTVRFSNSNDGVVEFLTPQRRGMRETQMYGSQFISDYLAPEAGYIAETTRFYRTTDEGKARNTNVDQKKNFYFRTRTKTLPDGSIISANYGKIYGDFDFSSGNIDKGFYANFGLVISYFNPTPNDRNVEFDMKRNLLSDGNVQQP